MRPFLFLNWSFSLKLTIQQDYISFMLIEFKGFYTDKFQASFYHILGFSILLSLELGRVQDAPLLRTFNN